MQQFSNRTLNGTLSLSTLYRELVRRTIGQRAAVPKETRLQNSKSFKSTHQLSMHLNSLMVSSSFSEKREGGRLKLPDFIGPS